MKKLNLILSFILLCFPFYSLAQNVAINKDGSNPNSSAMLDVSATDAGLLIPRMTSSQRNSITSPENGLIVYDTDMDLFYFNSGTSSSPIWVPISTGWETSKTRIKILPQDFLADDDGTDDESITHHSYEDDDTNHGVRPRISALEMYAFVSIPNGYKATHVRIYGSSTDLVTVYESDIRNGTWSPTLGSANTGTEIDITDVKSSSVNFLVIQINTNSSTDKLYGGYVTIAPY